MPVLAGVRWNIYASRCHECSICAPDESGGITADKKGESPPGRQFPAVLSRLVTLHVPDEREASLRYAGSIYADMRRVMITRSVICLYRALNPFPLPGLAWGF